jgi:hypothetical protein
VQHTILERHPGSRLRVYAIWTDRLPFDSRRRWDAAELVDRRVMHLWDGGDLAGRWLVGHARDFHGGDWDAYALFGPDARWTTTTTLAAPLSSGSTVIGSSAELAAAIGPLLTASTGRAPGTHRLHAGTMAA